MAWQKFSNNRNYNIKHNQKEKTYSWRKTILSRFFLSKVYFMPTVALIQYIIYSLFNLFLFKDILVSLKLKFSYFNNYFFSKKCKKVKVEKSNKTVHSGIQVKCFQNIPIPWSVFFKDNKTNKFIFWLHQFQMNLKWKSFSLVSFMNNFCIITCMNWHNVLKFEKTLKAM